MSSLKFTGTSMLFVNSANCVLLFLRDDINTIPYPNCWDIPGGRVEAGESPEECIVREMREELELALDSPQLFRRYEFPERYEYTFWQSADFNLATMRLHEGQFLKWFSEDDIRQMPDEGLAFNFKSVLLDFFKERPWV